MKTKKILWVNLFAIAIISMAIVFTLVSCGGGGGSGGGTGAISGKLTDSSGDPIEGATIVAGNSSPTAITDKDGNFTILGVSEGTVPVNTIAPGYETNSFSVTVSKDSTTAIPAAVRLPEVDDVSNAPKVTNVQVSISGSNISVTATINPGDDGDSVSDTRAELIGYGVGSVMTASGSTYSATITVPSTFVGPLALIKVFAIDDTGRVGANVGVASVSGASGSGSFSTSTFADNWAGSLKFHRASLDADDKGVGDKRHTNISFDISGTTVTGKVAEIRIEPTIDPASWGVVADNFTGTLTLIDASKGFYEITSTFTAGTYRTVDLTLIGKLDSATSPSNFVGYLQATITDTSTTPSAVVNIFGRCHITKGFTWATSDLDGDWVWSEFIKRPLLTVNAPTATYKGPFQYNSSFTVASGTISDGKDTTGNTLSTSSAFSVTDTSLGIFSGTLTSSDGTTVTISGLLGPRKRHVSGLFSITNGSKTAYGPFWGAKIENPPHFTTSDFAQVKYDGTTINSIFKGRYHVTSGPDKGSSFNLTLKMDSSGNIKDGRIQLDSATVNLTGGSLSFADTTSGQVSGSATGGSTTFTVAPGGSRNASMGVVKVRLVGDFSLNVTGGTDTGFFFVHRSVKE